MKALRCPSMYVYIISFLLSCFPQAHAFPFPASFLNRFTNIFPLCALYVYILTIPFHLFFSPSFLPFLLFICNLQYVFYRAFNTISFLFRSLFLLFYFISSFISSRNVEGVPFKHISPNTFSTAWTGLLRRHTEQCSRRRLLLLWRRGWRRGRGRVSIIVIFHAK